MVELIDEDQGPPGETYRPAPMWPSDRPQPKGGVWMGALAAPEGADQVRLRVAVGDASPDAALSPGSRLSRRRRPG